MAISSGDWINILGTFCIFMPALLIKEVMANPGWKQRILMDVPLSSEARDSLKLEAKPLVAP